MAFLRVSGKRTLAKWNAFDLVVTVAFGSILATVILSLDVYLWQGVLAFLILIGLQAVVTWSCSRFERAERWVKSEPRLLVHKGELRRQAMWEERVTESEIFAALRGRGVAALERVEAVVLETDGSFSVILQSPDSLSALKGVRGCSADSDLQ